MKSYAAVDRIEGDFVVCELEMIGIEESKPEDCRTKETVMVDIPVDAFSFFVDNELGEKTEIIEKILEGSIFVVEHENGEIRSVCGEDEAEKNRRIEYLQKLLNKK